MSGLTVIQKKKERSGTLILVMEGSLGTPKALFYSFAENKGRLSSVLILQICEIEPGPVGLRYSWIASVQEYTRITDVLNS